MDFETPIERTAADNAGAAAVQGIGQLDCETPKTYVLGNIITAARGEIGIIRAARELPWLLTRDLVGFPVRSPRV